MLQRADLLLFDELFSETLTSVIPTLCLILLNPVLYFSP